MHQFGDMAKPESEGVPSRGVEGVVATLFLDPSVCMFRLCGCDF